MAILPAETIDLQLFPEPDRFEIWHDIISRDTAPSQFTSPHASDFTGFARVVDLGTSRIAAFRYPELTMYRSQRMIRRGDPELYELALPLTGTSVLDQERRQCFVQPAEFTFLTTSRPYECQHVPEQAPLPSSVPSVGHPRTADTVAVLFPQSAIPLPQSKLRRLLAQRLPSVGMASLLARLLLQVAQHPEQFRSSDAGPLGSVALDLISATLAQHLDLEQTLPAEMRQQALRTRIDAFISEHLDDPDLNARTIAAAHHVSVRTVYRLWEGEGMGIAELIRHRRLERCRRDLVNPILADRPIYAIAARSGFSDRGKFARIFRATYGMSPQAYRQQASPPE
ncbi:helix-turn-helix domain-containing protein [Micromonospora sp. NPDC000442]|uniref:helix-turn-helix domain-containing protein n=1 Tax=Micromonospora sp. NPDC000442 TaxID=3364217 RepID=UPI0036AC94E3